MLRGLLDANLNRQNARKIQPRSRGICGQDLALDSNVSDHHGYLVFFRLASCVSSSLLVRLSLLEDRTCPFNFDINRPIRAVAQFQFVICGKYLTAIWCSKKTVVF